MRTFLPTILMNHTAYPHKLIRHPETPINGSPLPWLTSLHATWQRGPYGRADYRGNCSGYLIKDLLRYFGSTRVLDPLCVRLHNGSMNDLVLHAKFWLVERELSPHDVACELNDIPMSALDYASPREALKSLQVDGQASD